MQDFRITIPRINEIPELLIVLFQAFDRPIPPDIENQEKLLIDLIENGIAHFLALKQNNKTCGLGAVFFFGKVCSIGYMAVLREYRKRGYGTMMFNSLMDYAKDKDCETFTLYASNLGEPIYKKFGFQGRFTENTYTLPKNLKHEEIKEKSVQTPQLIPEWVLKLDCKTIGFERSHYLNILIKHGFKLLIVENEGYGLISGTRLGPLIAKSLDSAVNIIRESVFFGADHIIIPAHSKIPMELFNRIKLVKKESPNNRMMTMGKELNGKLEYFYALGTYAKG